MVVAIVGAELAFWLLIVRGLTARYVLKRPRVGAVLLAATPLVDLALLAFVVLDLRSGPQPSWTHGLGAVYLGFSAAYGRRLIRWADLRFRAGRRGGRTPRAPRRFGADRLRYEWRETGVFASGAGVAIAVLVVCALLVGDLDRAQPLTSWIGTLLMLVVVSLIWPISYTLWPARPAGGREPPA